jgi:hypothetical protein
MDVEEAGSSKSSVLFVDRNPASNSDGFSNEATFVDTSNILLSGASGNAQQPSTFASVVSNLSGLLPGIINCNSLIISNQTPFVHGIINGHRPIIGIGSKAQNHGLQLVQVWGMAGTDTSMSLSRLTHKQLHLIPTLVPKLFFEADKRGMLEEQPLLCNTFNSDTPEDSPGGIAS